MTLTDITAGVSVALSLTSIMSVFYFVGVKLATLQIKVDTMWEFTLRRGKSEAINNGFAIMQSPLVVTEKGKWAVAPIIDEIREAYTARWLSLSNVDLAVEVERAFGDRVLEEICIPHKFNMGACLIIILHELRPEMRH
jgi:hypothetical protein